MLFALNLLFLSCFSVSNALAEGVCRAGPEGGICGAGKELQSQGKHRAAKPRYPKLLVFVSFSMPLETLKALAKQVNALGGALVFRGLVNGNFKETALKLKELGQEVLIDPTLFEAYGITSVPTFVLRRSAGDMLDEKVPYDRLRGNVSLPHALEQFGTQGDGQEEAQTLLQKLKKS